MTDVYGELSFVYASVCRCSVDVTSTGVAGGLKRVWALAVTCFEVGSSVSWCVSGSHVNSCLAKLYFVSSDSLLAWCECAEGIDTAAAWESIGGTHPGVCICIVDCVIDERVHMADET